MTYVYLIESVHYQGYHYVGITDNLKQRFADHNEGRSVHTRKFLPWHLVTYSAFADVPMWQPHTRNISKPAQARRS